MHAYLITTICTPCCHIAGTYAEYATIKSDLLATIPDNVSFDEAAALPLVSLTAMQASHTPAAAHREANIALCHGCQAPFCLSGSKHYAKSPATAVYTVFPCVSICSALQTDRCD